MRLKDKVALVTGAGSGIGKEIALKFARESAKVVVNDINSETGRAVVDEINSSGGTAAFIQGDTSRAADARKLVDFSVETYGSLACLVNNAGIEIVKPFLEMTEEDLDRVNDINMKGVFLVGQYAGLQMTKQESGSIVNIASVAGLQGFPLLSGYCVSKHGVVGLTRVMALELREKNIRVNAVCPGFFKTPLADRFVATYEAAGFPVEELVKMKQVRWGKLGEVADAALYLASDESSFINGITLPVDNGHTIC